MAKANRHEEGQGPGVGERRRQKKAVAGIGLPDLTPLGLLERATFLYRAVPPAAAITLALVYLKAEQWQESLQWGLMGLGLTMHVVPRDLLPLGRGQQKASLVMLAAGAVLFGFWVVDRL